jgi:hypothetical protein
MGDNLQGLFLQVKKRSASHPQTYAAQKSKAGCCLACSACRVIYLTACNTEANG